MATFLALLRGINVGGNNPIKMADLRACMEDLGARQVETVVQSGNAVFDLAPSKRGSFQRSMVKTIGERFACEPRVLLLSASELFATMDANPYPEAVQAPKTLHLLFLEKRPGAPKREAIQRLCAADESWSLLGRCFYLHAPRGIGRSKLAAGAEKCLGVSATGRNWSTLTKLRVLMNRDSGE